MEDGSWALCPLDYSYDPNLVLVNGTGFDITLHNFQFEPGRPNSSTPENMTGATAIPQVPPLPPLSRQSAVTHGQDQQLGDASGFSTLDRYPGVSKPVLCQLSPQRVYATNWNLNQGLKQPLQLGCQQQIYTQ